MDIFTLDIVTYRKTGDIFQIKSKIPIGLEEFFMHVKPNKENNTYTGYTKTFSKKYKSVEGIPKDMMNKVLAYNDVNFNEKESGFEIKNCLTVQEAYNIMQTTILQMLFFYKIYERNK